MYVYMTAILNAWSVSVNFVNPSCADLSATAGKPKLIYIYPKKSQR